MDTTEEGFFEAIKAGTLSLAEFMAWVRHREDRAYNEGHENGYDDAMEE
jgi:hypothetical protein